VCDGDNFTDYPDPSVDRRFTVLAVQFRLGLLSEWRHWLGGVDTSHPSANGTDLTEIELKV
jgi:hypothetical protein